MIKDSLLILRYTYHRALNKVCYVKIEVEKLFLKLSSKIEVECINTYETKEPERIYLIEQFKKNSIFYNIGVNIGAFRLFAAAQFEKKIQNYLFKFNALNFLFHSHTIKINGFNDYLKSNSISILGMTRFSKLNINDLSSSSSYSQVD